MACSPCLSWHFLFGQKSGPLAKMRHFSDIKAGAGWVAISSTLLAYLCGQSHSVTMPQTHYSCHSAFMSEKWCTARCWPRFLTDTETPGRVYVETKSFHWRDFNMHVQRAICGQRGIRGQRPIFIQHHRHKHRSTIYYTHAHLPAKFESLADCLATEQPE